MNQALLSKAESKITAKKEYAERIAEENLQRAFKNELFKNLYKTEKELEIDIAKKEVYGEKVDYSKLEQLKTDIEFALDKIGLNTTDIYPNYECRFCNDTGYVNGAPCECLKKEINKALFEYSGYTEKLSRFEDNEIDHPAYKLMEKWCETKTDKINVLICGHTGTGKTFLTECIASKLMQKNRVVFFTTAFNMNNAMLNYHISFDTNREQIISNYLTAEVLIVDDLGSEPMLNKVTKEYLYLILNERMLAHLSTIFTTNLEFKDILETYGERIFSRLANKKTTISINLEGEDLRLKR